MKILLEEIERINEIMLGNNFKKLIINEELILEEILLNEQTVEALEKAKNFITREVEEVIDRYVRRGLNRTVEQKLDSFIYQNMTTSQGKQLIRSMIKDIAEVNPLYAESFAKDNQTYLEKYENLFKGDRQKALESLEKRFGKNIRNEYERLTSSRPNPKPPKPPKPPTIDVIPKELSNSEGIKKFQDWLNKNKSGWVNGSNMSTNGKSYGTFGPKTKKYWELFGEEYLENIKPPFELKTKDDILKFQDWLKDTGKWNEDTFNNFGGGALNDETRAAFERHKEAYRKILGFKYNLDVAVDKMLNKKITPKRKGYWDSAILETLHPATAKTVFNSLRKSLFFYYKSIQLYRKGAQVEIDSLFQKLLSAIEIGTADYNASKTLLRDISISMASLRKNSEMRFDLFLKDIEKSLVEGGASREKVSQVINDLKTYSAWDDMFIKPEKSKYPSWFLELISESVIMKSVKGIFTGWKPVWSKMFVKIFNLIERTLMFLTTGHIRTVEEITQFCYESGVKEGIKKYLFVLYWMKIIVTPALLSTGNFLRTMGKDLINPNEGEWAIDWNEVWSKSVKPFEKLYNETAGNLLKGDIGGFVLGILPFNWYWDNLDALMDANAQQKLADPLKKKKDEMQQTLEELKRKKEVADSLFNDVVNKQKIEMDRLKMSVDSLKNNTPILDVITNSEIGFKAWCIKNQKTFYIFSKDGSGVSYTKDGAKWQWGKNSEGNDDFIPW
jgi:hypothetical protein